MFGRLCLVLGGRVVSSLTAARPLRVSYHSQVFHNYRSSSILVRKRFFNTHVESQDVEPLSADKTNEEDSLVEVFDDSHLIPNVPRVCFGCGSKFQTSQPDHAGFLPLQKLSSFMSNKNDRRALPLEQQVGILSKDKGVQLQPMDYTPVNEADVAIVPSRQQRKTARDADLNELVCLRCHEMKNYGKFVTVEGALANTEPHELLNQILSKIPRRAIVVHIVDIFDFNGSYISALADHCDSNGIRFIIALTKLDLLPIRKKYEQLYQWIAKAHPQLTERHRNNIFIISSSSGFGVAGLLDTLRTKAAKSPGAAVYVIGCTNAGKSSFINKLVFFAVNKPRKVTSAPPLHPLQRTARAILTTSAYPGTTLDIVQLPFSNQLGFKLFDTPGIPNTTQIAHRLKSNNDLIDILPKREIVPITYRIVAGRSLLIGALVRLDVIEGDAPLVTCFFSNKITLHITSTNRVTEVLEKHAGTMLHPPNSEADVKALGPFVTKRYEIECLSTRHSAADIEIAGLGWVAVGGKGRVVVDIHVPEGVQTFQREPLLPDELYNRGITKFFGTSIRR
eukprot:GILJ01013110.1.p1 GENE.GILJ01013110.1~~GILJ01013110.1.p1  ORF type:complete len:563 (-),score=71.37 GILJ01013110.1:207-1895(-)